MKGEMENVMTFFKSSKRSKILMVTILVLTLVVAYAVPMSVFATDGELNPPQSEEQTVPGNEQGEQDPEGNPDPDFPTDSKTPTPGGVDVIDDQEDSGEGEQGMMFTLAAPAAGGIDLVKTVSQKSASPGETVTYTFKIINKSNRAPLKDIKLTDPLLGNDWCTTFGAIGANSNKSIKVDYLIPENFDAAELVNTASVVGYYESGESKLEVTDSDSVKVTMIPKYAISLQKTVWPLTAAPGDTVTYTFKIKNIGKNQLEDIQLKDKLFGENWEKTIRNLGRNKVETFTEKYVIPDPYSDSVLTNTAIVTGKYDAVIPQLVQEETESSRMPKPDPKPDSVRLEVSATASAEVKIIPKYGLLLEKTVDKEFATAGEEVIYTFKVTNIGKYKLDNVELRDKLFNKYDKNGTLKYEWVQNVNFKYSDVKTFTQKYKIPDHYSESILTNTAIVSGDYYVQNDQSRCIPQKQTLTVTDSALVTIIPKYGISLEKTVSPEYASPGDSVTYTFTVKNIGKYDLKNVTVTDPKLTAEPGTVWKESFGRLKSGDVVSCSAVHVLPDDAVFPYVNEATATGEKCYSSGPEPRCVEKVSATASAIVRAKSDEPDPNYGISLDKSVNPDKASPGDKVTYTFFIKNTGTTTLSGVTLIDPLFEDEEVMIPTFTLLAAQTTIFDRYGRYEIGEMGPGEEKTVTQEFTLPNDVVFPFKNTARVVTNQEVSDEDDATIEKYVPGSTDTGSGSSSRNRTGSTVLIAEEEIPAAPIATEEAVVLNDVIPAGQLPKTGGIDSLLLYGLGALLAGGGFAMKRRDKIK
ncbi:DUF7507 domain-containing protein [Sinanaerobacter chloroacetimidivorans]|uniref:DUF7507 domain-containing protein n=1 Tax=Sinanaerobacter chloroacetimidivorans TaxID=2818044 RepID=UPI001D04547A|nr:LPXTG cell wall anchor domain-containing protein [Sinanaerobacter chloroacetimidivorans]